MESREQLQKVAFAIKDIKVAMLTTVDAQGRLQSRPMATHEILPFEFDGNLWFYTTKDCPKVQDIRNNNHVNVSFVDTQKHHYVSVSGTATLVEDPQLIQRFWHSDLNDWFPRGPDKTSMELIRVEMESAHLWDAPQNRLTQIYGAVRTLFKGNNLDHRGSTEKIEIHPS